MISRGIGALFRGYERAKTNLPSEVRTAIESRLPIGSTPQLNIGKLESLGRKIGLEREEVIAATSLSIDNMDSRTRARISPLSALVAIFAVICIGFFMLLLLAGGGASDAIVPTYTYAPGTRYGSISPTDFTST